MASTKQELAKAFELIRQDRLEDAIQLIKPITQSEPDNPDAWWLLANAASEPRDARRALVNLLKLNPRYPKARDLLEQLNEIHPPNDQELMMLMELEEVQPDFPSASPQPSSFEGGIEDSFNISSEIDDLFKESAGERGEVGLSFDQQPTSGGEDDWALPDDVNPFIVLLEEEEARERAGGGASKRALLLVGAGVTIVLVVAALVIVLGGSGGKAAPPPSVAVDAGPLMSINAEFVSAEKKDILEAVRSEVEKGAQLELGSESSAIFTPVEGGNNALVVQVCAEPTPDLPQIVTKGLNIVIAQVQNVAEAQGALAMVGVNVQDCLNGSDTLYRALAPIQAVIDFGSSQSSDFATAFLAFQQTWVVDY